MNNVFVWIYISGVSALGEGRRVTVAFVAGEWQMRVLHKTMKVVAEALQKCNLRLLIVKTWEIVEW